MDGGNSVLTKIKPEAESGARLFLFSGRVYFYFQGAFIGNTTCTVAVRTIRTVLKLLYCVRY